MRKSKTLLFLLCVTIFISLLTACRSSANKEDKGDETSLPSEGSQSEGKGSDKKEIDFSQHKEYTWWTFADEVDYYSEYSDNPVVWYLNKKFNVTLKFVHPPKGSESDALSVMMASGEYTDLVNFAQYRGSIAQLCDDGVIIDIAKYLDYMPNLKALMDKDPDYRKAVYSDDKRIFKVPILEEQDGNPWGGMVYRADILNAMTGGKPQFPSGNSEPTTIEDWDYMLPLFKQYFEKAGFKDYAVLIIPYNGFLPFGELVTGFGAAASYYVEDGKVKFGPIQDGFYNYLAKMKEWYEKGYIYKDFATRVNDPFYLPNPALVYGGAAGIWYGLLGQLGTTMSMPDKGLNMEVKPLKNPIDTEYGIEKAPSFNPSLKSESAMGPSITVKCQDVERLLTVLDYLYSEEGMIVRSYGLMGKDAAENEIYVKAGIPEGAYTVENGEIKMNPKFQEDAKLKKNEGALWGMRLPGLNSFKYLPGRPIEKEAQNIWAFYNDKQKIWRLPFNLTRTAEEDEKFVANSTKMEEYINTMVQKFIMGAVELNEQTWNQFKEQLKQYGLEENISIMQAAYDRYLNR